PVSTGAVSTVAVSTGARPTAAVSTGAVSTGVPPLTSGEGAPVDTGSEYPALTREGEGGGAKPPHEAQAGEAARSQTQEKRQSKKRPRGSIAAGLTAPFLTAALSALLLLLVRPARDLDAAICLIDGLVAGSFLPGGLVVGRRSVRSPYRPLI